MNLAICCIWPVVHNRKLIIAYSICALVVACLLAIIIAHILTPVLFPDELEFFQISLKHLRACGIFCPAENNYGYASLWWNLFQLAAALVNRTAQTATSWTFSNPDDPALKAIMIMRAASMAAYLGAIACAANAVKARPERSLAVLTLLLMPLTWWNARWAGPDFIGMAVAIIGMVHYLRRRFFWALAFWGAAISFRLINAFALSGFMALCLLELVRDEKRPIKKLAFGAVCVIAGMLIACPDYLLDPLSSVKRAQGLPLDYEQGLTLHQWFQFVCQYIFGDLREWDTQSLKSICAFLGGPLGVLALIATGIASRQYKILFAAGAGLIICLAALVVRGFGYGWYFMPVLAATYVACAMTAEWSALPQNKRRLLVALQLAGLAFAIPHSIDECKVFFERAKLSAASDKDKNCVLQSVASRPADARLWLIADPTYTVLPVDSKAIENGQMFTLVQAKVLMNAGNDPLQLQRDWIVTSLFLIDQNFEIRRISQEALEKDRHRTCGPFVVFAPIKSPDSNR